MDARVYRKYKRLSDVGGEKTIQECALLRKERAF